MCNFGRIAFDHGQLAGKRFGEFSQRGQAAAVHFNCGHLRSGAQQGPGQAAGAGANLEHLLTLQFARQLGNAGEQLLVEQKVLPQCLGREQTVARDDFA